MKKKIFTFALSILLPILVIAQTESSSTIDDLLGSWTIDLRPSPDAEGYYQTFKVLSVDKNELKGSFYNSKIKNGLINDNWDSIYFAFSTSDGTNDYYHSGYLKNGRIYGISYCPGREFAMPWNGVKILKN